MHFLNSKIDEIVLNNQKYFIKRDDLLHKDFSGNKARKLYFFLQDELKGISKIISYGSAQSNFMYSLSVLCKLKNLKFDYYVSHLNTFLKENPCGNYKEAIKNGMNLLIKDLPNSFKDDELFINEGGRVKEARFGIKILANEIKNWAKEKNIDNLKVFLPSGTGTTALYLQKFLSFEVLTISCVGDDTYLKKQFLALEKKNFPRILKKEKKYHFGKLYIEFYQKYLELLNQTNIEFDLLYDSLAWIVLENYVKSLKNKDEYKFLYIHQGGILGNETMIARYKHKFKNFY